MDKFINTSNGGISLVNNDFRWSDESIRDFIDNHLSDLAVTIGSNGNFYLSGVNISYSAPNYIITEGYVYINGEIVKVDAQTCNPLFLLPTEEYRFEVVETYDTTGAKVTLSGTNINTYKKRRAVPTIVTTASPLTSSQLVFAVTASQERLQEKIDKLLGSVTYTEHNYIADGEKITDSIDALDVQLKDVSDNVSTNLLKIKTFSGTWDMDTDATKVITDSFFNANFLNIKSVNVSIIDNSNTEIRPLNSIADTSGAGAIINGGVTGITSAAMGLRRHDSSLFNAAGYNAASYIVTIYY